MAQIEGSLSRTAQAAPPSLQGEKITIGWRPELIHHRGEVRCKSGALLEVEYFTAPSSQGIREFSLLNAATGQALEWPSLEAPLSDRVLAVLSARPGNGEELFELLSAQSRLSASWPRLSDSMDRVLSLVLLRLGEIPGCFRHKVIERAVSCSRWYEIVQTWPSLGLRQTEIMRTLIASRRTRALFNALECIPQPPQLIKPDKLKAQLTVADSMLTVLEKEPEHLSERFALDLSRWISTLAAAGRDSGAKDALLYEIGDRTLALLCPLSRSANERQFLPMNFCQRLPVLGLPVFGLTYRSAPLVLRLLNADPEHTEVTLRHFLPDEREKAAWAFFNSGKTSWLVSGLAAIASTAPASQNELLSPELAAALAAQTELSEFAPTLPCFSVNDIEAGKILRAALKGKCSEHITPADLAHFPRSVLDCINEPHPAVCYLRDTADAGGKLWPWYRKKHLWELGGDKPGVASALIEIARQSGAEDIDLVINYLGLREYAELDREDPPPPTPITPLLADPEWAYLPRDLVKAGFARYLFPRNIEHFRLGDKHWRAVVEALIDEGQAKLLLENISRIPRPVLDRLEHRWHILKYRGEVGIYDSQVFACYIKNNLFAPHHDLRSVFGVLGRECGGRICEGLSSAAGLRSAEILLGLLDSHTDWCLENADLFELGAASCAQALEVLVSKGRLDLILEKGARLFPRDAFQALESRRYLLSYMRDLNFPAREAYEAYAALKRQGNERALALFVSRFRGVLELAIGSSAQTDDLPQYPFYRTIIEHIYPNHAPGYTSFDSNESCADRSADLSGFKIRKRYTIDLAEGQILELRPGYTRDEAALSRINAPLLYKQKVSFLDSPSTELNSYLQNALAGMRRNLDPVFSSPQEKIFAMMLEWMCGEVSSDSIKKALIAYHCTSNAGCRQYAEGTRDEANKSKNREYCYLLSLHEFYADEIKETVTKICAPILNSPRFETVLTNYAARVAAIHYQKRRGSALARRQLDKRGATPAFLKRLADIAAATPPSARRTAISSFIACEQRKISKLVQEATGREVCPDDIPLTHQWLELQLKEPEDTAASPGNFGSLLAYAFESIFADELQILRREIDKYRPINGKTQRIRRLEAYFTKNHTSAHARGVGGVCVSGDNPGKSRNLGRRCQWDLANYFQLVLRDPETMRCEGLVLLHHYSQGGQRILTASFNPTSTYLFKVDEQQLFAGLLQTLITFARDNRFDIIACSTTETVRTNRSGGPFDQALRKRISAVKESFRLDEPVPFSFNPGYSQQYLDVLWHACQSGQPVSKKRRAKFGFDNG